MTASSDLVELERHLNSATRGYEAAIAELNRRAATILALEADKAALVEAGTAVVTAFNYGASDLPLAVGLMSATLAKHGGE